MDPVHPLFENLWSRSVPISTLLQPTVPQKWRKVLFGGETPISHVQYLGMIVNRVLVVFALCGSLYSLLTVISKLKYLIFLFFRNVQRPTIWHRLGANNVQNLMKFRSKTKRIRGSQSTAQVCISCTCMFTC